ncbi:MAG: tetratricopeptide repeat protein [Kiloniellales bacterium]
MLWRLSITIFAIAVVGLVPRAPAADFAEGLRAYDAGDYATARDEWMALALAGDADAQVAIADLYRSGLGLQQSDAKAAVWYRRAAESGHVVAQMNLGELYRHGRGVERDPVLAWFWFSLAADQGHPWARGQRAQLAAGLSDRDRARGEGLLADWRGRH